MAQTKSQSAEAFSSILDNKSYPLAIPPVTTIELIRRPLDDGTFGTVSYKVSVSGTNQDIALQIVDTVSIKLESKYGVTMNNRKHQVIGRNNSMT